MRTIEARGLRKMIENNAEDVFGKLPNLNKDYKKSKCCFQNPQRHKRIVVIDDEPKIRILFKNILSKAGYETIAFGDNSNAIKYLKDKTCSVDLLLLDLDMPHIDGRYFCEIVRNKHPRAKILIASNFSLDIQKYLIFDADDYFDKSEGIQALKKKVKRVLSMKEQKNKRTNFT